MPLSTKLVTVASCHALLPKFGGNRSVMKSIKAAAIVIAPTSLSEVAASGEGMRVSFGEEVIEVWQGAILIHHIAP